MITRSCALSSLASAVIAMLVATPPLARAQSASSGTLAVHVSSAETGRPVAGAVLRLRHGLSVTGTTDSAGLAVLRDVPAGVTDEVDVRHPAFVAASASVLVEPGAVRAIEVRLRSIAVRLDTVVATAAHASNVPGFDDRRRTGHGYYVTRDDIERERPTVTTDLLRHVPGIRLFPVSGGYRVRSTRGASSRDCPLSLYLNGLPMTNEISRFGSSAGIPASVLDGITPQTIEALEIYGVSEVPPQFNRGDSSCGVILIWTRILRPDPDSSSSHAREHARR